MKTTGIWAIVLLVVSVTSAMPFDEAPPESPVVSDSSTPSKAALDKATAIRQKQLEEFNDEEGMDCTLDATEKTVGMRSCVQDNFDDSSFVQIKSISKRDVGPDIESASKASVEKSPSPLDATPGSSMLQGGTPEPEVGEGKGKGKGKGPSAPVGKGKGEPPKTGEGAPQPLGKGKGGTPKGGVPAWKQKQLEKEAAEAAEAAQKEQAMAAEEEGLRASPNGRGCPFVAVDTDLYTSVREVKQKHPWISSFVGAVNYATKSCSTYGQSVIQREHITGRCLKMTADDPCCADLVRNFGESKWCPKEKDKEDLEKILEGAPGNNRCVRNSDEQLDFKLFPELCKFTGADCLFTDDPGFSAGRTAAEIYVCPKSEDTSIGHATEAYQVRRNAQKMCILTSADGTTIGTPFISDPTEPDPRDWTGGITIRTEATRLDNLGGAGSAIPYR